MQITYQNNTFHIHSMNKDVIKSDLCKIFPDVTDDMVNDVFTIITNRLDAYANMSFTIKIRTKHIKIMKKTVKAFRKAYDMKSETKRDKKLLKLRRGALVLLELEPFHNACLYAYVVQRAFEKVGEVPKKDYIPISYDDLLHCLEKDYTNPTQLYHATRIMKTMLTCNARGTLSNKQEDFLLHLVNLTNAIVERPKQRKKRVWRMGTARIKMDGNYNTSVSYFT